VDECKPLLSGIGAGAVTRKKLHHGKIAIDAERAQKMATRKMNVSYDPPHRPRGLQAAGPARPRPCPNP
jgi:hypothetical protein